MPRRYYIIFLFILLVLNSGPQIDVRIDKEYYQAQEGYGDYIVTVCESYVDIINTPEAFDGHNLFVLLRTDAVTLEREFILLILGNDGHVVLEEYLPENEWISDCPAEFIDPESILVRHSNTTAIYNMTDGSVTLLPFEGHHEFEYNPVNDTFFTFHYDVRNIDDVDYLYDTLIEFDREGNVVWSFNASSLMSLEQECPFQDILWTYPDISHANTIFYDVEDDSIYLMLRNANTFWKIDHSTGDVVWGLGEYGNFSLYNKWGQLTNNLFFHAHAVERIDENTFILFDNDFHNHTNDLNRDARILEIVIDENTMTANTSWVWTADPDYSSYLWGDADRLPNGNRLGAFGFIVRSTTNYGGRLVEVNEDHDIVWEMSFVNNESYWYGMYRVERFQFQPILQLVDSSNRFSEGDVTVDWHTWFNFRPKRDMHGTFELFLDNVLIDEGEVIFDRYWRPTSISHTFQNLSLGTYNATLVVWDGYGNTATSTKLINVTNEDSPLLVIFILSMVGLVSLVVLWRRHSGK
jgi:hypothetical protein